MSAAYPADDTAAVFGKNISLTPVAHEPEVTLAPPDSGGHGTCLLHLAEVASPRRQKEASMQVICAWCAQEGKPTLPLHKPPFDDTSVSHGICTEHLAIVQSEIRARFARQPLAA